MISWLTNKTLWIRSLAREILSDDSNRISLAKVVYFHSMGIASVWISFIVFKTHTIEEFVLGLFLAAATGQQLYSKALDKKPNATTEMQ